MKEFLVESRFERVKTVLVVTSPIAEAIDRNGLKNFITQAYPGSVVFFESTSGMAIGPKAAGPVDLVIDFTPPGARQRWYFPMLKRRKAAFCVGRNAGCFGYRKARYDRVVDDEMLAQQGVLPTDYLAKERAVQHAVLASAGIARPKHGGTTADLSKSIGYQVLK